MKKVNIGIVGLGELGNVHGENLRYRIPNSNLVAICANEEERVQQLKEKWGINAGYTDLNEMLEKENLDALVIASSTAAHCEHSLAAINAGLHIFCEKPIGLTIEECLEIENAVKQSDKIYMVGFMRRFDPSYAEAKQRIDAGEIGKPIFFRGYSLDPTYVAEYLAKRADKNGCWFIDMTVHDYDLARWFLDSEPESVYACGGAYVYPIFEKTNDIDNGYALMRFKNNSCAFYYSGRTAPHGAHVETEIVGTEGILRIGEVPRKNRLKQFTKDGAVEECLDLYLDRWGEAYYLELQEFVDSIQENRTPITTAHDGTMASIMGVTVQKSYVENNLQRF